MIPAQNILFVGARNSGKTTILRKIVDGVLHAGGRIIVIDSATAHANKSLIVQISKQKKVHIQDGSKSNQVGDLSENIILVDVSSHLENSYNFPDGGMRTQERELYIRDVQSLLENLISSRFNTSKTAIIMDEIEINNDIIMLITRLNTQGVFVYGSLHPHLLGTVNLDQYFSVVSTPCEMNIKFPRKEATDV